MAEAILDRDMANHPLRVFANVVNACLAFSSGQKFPEIFNDQLPRGTELP